MALILVQNNLTRIFRQSIIGRAQHPEDRARSRAARGRERGGERGRDREVKMMATDAEEIRIQTSPCPMPDNSLSTLSIKITRKNQDRQWKLRFIYLQCCEYRHTPRRSEQNTPAQAAPARAGNTDNTVLPLHSPTFGFSQQIHVHLSHCGGT